MRTDNNKDYQVKEKYEWRAHQFEQEQRMQQGRPASLMSQATLETLLRRLLQGLGKVAVVARYLLSRFSWNWRPFALPKWKISWWKVGLAALAVFIVLKKDIQFSINMRAPVGAGIRDDDHAGDSRGADELNVAQSVAFREENHSSPASTALTDDQQVQAYIGRFAGVAVSEMKRFGIPASITMAQGILESGAGTTAAARRENNHFGKPLAGQSYASAWENWREHSLLLYHEYSTLFDNGLNYKKWARGLRQAKYSSDRNYDRKLIDLIERYQLFQLDKQ